MSERARIRRVLHWRRLLGVAVAAGSVLFVSCKGDKEKDDPRVLLAARIGPATARGDTTTKFPDDGQWVRPGKDFQGTRFSGLYYVTRVRHVFE